MALNSWCPSASLSTLQLSACLRDAIRAFMRERGVLEVITPALSSAATSDPHIHSLKVNPGWCSQTHYLHTSPEFAMKRLLAAYNVDIYQLCTVFRDDELGRFHNPEFSLLEWYRTGFDHHALMAEMKLLLQQLFAMVDKAWHEPNYLSYSDAVKSATGLAPDDVTVAQIEALFESRSRSWPASIENDLDAAMNLLIDEFVLPSFATDRFTFLVDYPASQAALSRIGCNAEGHAVAERFELYWGTVELANGFHELADAREQRLRFNDDLQRRTESGLSQAPIDEHLLSALEHGLPDCAGVALGIDRLIMVLTNASQIADVMAFEVQRA